MCIEDDRLLCGLCFVLAIERYVGDSGEASFAGVLVDLNLDLWSCGGGSLDVAVN